MSCLVLYLTHCNSSTKSIIITELQRGMTPTERSGAALKQRPWIATKSLQPNPEPSLELLGLAVLLSFLSLRQSNLGEKGLFPLRGD